MYHVGAQGVDERMINVHYYYKYRFLFPLQTFSHHRPSNSIAVKPSDCKIQTHRRLKRTLFIRTQKLHANYRGNPALYQATKRHLNDS